MTVVIKHDYRRISQPIDDSTSERVEISQRIPQLGESIPPAYVSLYDDSGYQEAVFTLAQIPDIIAALTKAQEEWEK